MGSETRKFEALPGRMRIRPGNARIREGKSENPSVPEAPYIFRARFQIYLRFSGSGLSRAGGFRIARARSAWLRMKRI